MPVVSALKLVSERTRQEPRMGDAATPTRPSVVADFVTDGSMTGSCKT